MGLDLIVESRAKPSHEAEWRTLVQRAFDEDPLTAADVERFQEISVPAFACLGAPRVGHDKAANEWIIVAQKATTPDAAAEALKTFHGHYALPLVTSDGLPKYTHGGLYDGVDETSFRGAFLSDCDAVLDDELLGQAWEHKMPETAIAYGQALLLAATRARAEGPRPPQAQPKRSLLSFLAPKRKTVEPLPLDEQLDIVQTAGRWFTFWGERGHPIRAWS